MTTFNIYAVLDPVYRMLGTIRLADRDIETLPDGVVRVRPSRLPAVARSYDGELLDGEVLVVTTETRA